LNYETEGSKQRLVPDTEVGVFQGQFGSGNLFERESIACFIHFIFNLIVHLRVSHH